MPAALCRVVGQGAMAVRRFPAVPVMVPRIRMPNQTIPLFDRYSPFVHLPPRLVPHKIAMRRAPRFVPSTPPIRWDRLKTVTPSLRIPGIRRYAAAPMGVALLFLRIAGP